MAIRILKLRSGERLPMVAANAWAPADPWVTAYLLSESRGAKNAASTTHNRAKSLEKVGRVCQELELPGAAEAAEGRYATTEQLRLMAQGLSSPAGAILTTARPYFDEFTRFVRWVGVCVDPKGEDQLRAARSARFERAASAARPPAIPKPAVPRYGLTERERDTFLDAIVPSADHPRRMAFRNYVVGLLAFMLGLRSGEILGIKVCDVETRDRSPVLNVVKRANDPDDHRTRPAAQKTVGRTLPLSGELAAALDQLKVERKLLGAAETHPYLIVNHYGQPLSDRGFRNIYGDLRRRHPELATLINHVLRHDWNDRWNDMVKAKGWDDDEALRLRKYMMGWSEASKMPSVYGMRSIERDANEQLLRMQRRGIRRVKG